MTPSTVGMSSASTASAGGASASPVAAPDTAPASADFLALLLLTIGVGTGTPQSEGETADQDSDRDTTDLTALAATAPIAIAATMPMTTTVPLPSPAAGGAAAPASASETGATTTISMTTEPSATTAAMIGAPDAAPASRAAQREPAPANDTAAPASAAHHALAELGADTLDDTTDATPPATSQIPVESAPAPRPVTGTTVRPTTNANDAREADRAASADATTTPKAAPVAPTERPETMKASKPETAERHLEPATRPEPVPHGPDVVALHAHTEVAPHAVTADGAAGVSAAQAPAAAVEPQVVADQVVRAARLVVDDGLAQMRVDLQPPALGGVRVQADVRGEVVMLTITAERPETQALLTQALPDIQQALVRRDVGPTTVAIIGSTATPLSSDGRRAPERRPETPRERPTPHSGERRRTLRASRGVSAVDITV